MIQVRLVGGTQRHGVAALDRDQIELPDHVVLNGEKFMRQGRTSIYIYIEQVPQ